MSSDFIERRAARLMAQADYLPEGSEEQIRLQALGRDLLGCEAHKEHLATGIELWGRIWSPELPPEGVPIETSRQ